MRAHTVKCQICAPGVVIVTFVEVDAPESADRTQVVVSGNLTDDEAVELVARQVAIDKTAEAEKLHGEGIVYTSDEVKAGYRWSTARVKILAHL